MKKSIIALVLSTLVISGMNVCASENITNTNEIEEALAGEEQNGESMETENTDLDSEKILEKEETEDDILEDFSGSEEVEQDIDEKSRVCLQVPQKLDLMVDPFEINEKGQIYSENYIIKNAGAEAGILTLSDIICKPGDKSEVNIITANEGMHETDEKTAYVKIVFENDEEVVLSQEGAEYKVRLAPGEELRFHYSGEVNENASRSWRERDITVGMTYFWNVEDVSRENITENKLKLPEIMSVETDQLNIKDELDDSDENILEDESGGDEE